MLDDILSMANKYAEGVKRVLDRRDQWFKKHQELKDHLTQIADYLNANAAYKQGFFVDTLHAFNEDMNGTCADIPSVALRSGEMPMLVQFHNNMGEKKEFIEQGFSVTFNPIITGQVIVLLTPHQSDLNPEKPVYTTLAIIDEPGQLTMDIAEQLLARGIEIAYHSSFTGISDRPEQKEEEELHPPLQHNPIGFRRYETTQKIK
jgi:hypothetical protein